MKSLSLYGSLAGVSCFLYFASVRETEDGKMRKAA